MRFRRTIKVAPGIKLNLSKSGVSTTFGGKGFSINSGSKGTYLNTGLPGTGLYSRKKLSGNSKSYSTGSYTSSSNKMFSEADLWTKKQSGNSIFVILMIAGIIFLFFQIIVAILLLSISLILMIRWIFTDAGKSTAQIRKARAEMEKMDYENAVESLEKAYTLYPNPHLVGDIIFQAKINMRFDIALKYLNQIDDSDLNIVFNKAECNYAIKNFEEAAKYFERLNETVDTVSQKDNLFSKFGISLFNIGEYKRAVEVLQKVSTDYDNQSMLTLLIGQSFYNLGDNDSAIFTLTNYIGRKRNFDENMIEMCYTLGHIYIKLSDNTKAKHWLNKVYTQDINYKDISTLLKSL